MPLNLLGKKSWNVYSPEAIARVKRDEALAEAREAEEDERLQQYDAQRRLALLRGEAPPPAPAPLEPIDPSNGRLLDSEEKKRARDGEREFKKKRRRLHGEDDTDRDIRVAREEREEREALIYKAGQINGVKQSRTDDAPLVDHKGHIRLFAAPKHNRPSKDEEAEAEARKKKQEFEQQNSMRFSDAVGRNAPEKPWYASTAPSNPQELDPSSASESKELVNASFAPGFQEKDVWGRDDPRRKEREKTRITSNDPFAFMQKAQTQLKAAERDRAAWKQERDKDIDDLVKLSKKEVRREDRRGRRERHTEKDDLEGFSLDAPVLPTERDERKRDHERHRRLRNKHHCRQSRSRSRSEDRRRYRDEDRHRSHRSRDKDKDNDRSHHSSRRWRRSRSRERSSRH